MSSYVLRCYFRSAPGQQPLPRCLHTGTSRSPRTARHQGQHQAQQLRRVEPPSQGAGPRSGQLTGRELELSMSWKTRYYRIIDFVCSKKKINCILYICTCNYSSGGCILKITTLKVYQSIDFYLTRILLSDNVVIATHKILSGYRNACTILTCRQFELYRTRLGNSLFSNVSRIRTSIPANYSLKHFRNVTNDEHACNSSRILTNDDHACDSSRILTNDDHAFNSSRILPSGHYIFFLFSTVLISLLAIILHCTRLSVLYETSSTPALASDSLWSQDPR